MKSQVKKTPSEILSANLDNNWIKTSKSSLRINSNSFNSGQSNRLKHNNSQVLLQDLPENLKKSESRRTFLAEKNSSIKTNGNFLNPSSMKENLYIDDLHISKQRNQDITRLNGKEHYRFPIGATKRSTEAFYVPGTFEKTYDNIFQKRKLTRNESRTQFIHDNETGGRKYDIISHTVLKDKWAASSQFQHASNKRMEHPSHIAMIQYKH